MHFQILVSSKGHPYNLDLIGKQVKGIRTHGYGYNEWDTYDETYIKNRQRQILWAINARKQHFPNEKPYEYAPFKGEEDKYVWNEKIRQQLIDEGYWNHTIVI